MLNKFNMLERYADIPLESEWNSSYAFFKWNKVFEDGKDINFSNTREIHFNKQALSNKYP